MKHPLRTLLLAVCCGLAAACTQRQERLKLMSYNIRNGIGIDNIQDIGRIARVILREAPDLVALQELDSATLRVDGRYIPGELGRMTGMHATFGRAIGFAGGSYGIGLLSRTEPTSPPVHWTPTPAARCWGFCSSCTSRDIPWC
jgi:endonuclease/exonuclease/phosphatase family metal-dependent hydrolase